MNCTKITFLPTEGTASLCEGRTGGTRFHKPCLAKAEHKVLHRSVLKHSITSSFTLTAFPVPKHWTGGQGGIHTSLQIVCYHLPKSHCMFAAEKLEVVKINNEQRHQNFISGKSQKIQRLREQLKPSALPFFPLMCLMLWAIPMTQLLPPPQGTHTSLGHSTRLDLRQPGELPRTTLPNPDNWINSGSSTLHSWYISSSLCQY